VKRRGKPYPVAVFRTADDRVFALVNHSPHCGAPLSEGVIRGCTVACPLHGWVMDPESGKALLPDDGAAAVAPGAAGRRPRLCRVLGRQRPRRMGIAPAGLRRAAS
jgi:nitrite reductase/ring-hydroxylating ferredoxin subunit